MTNSELITLLKERYGDTDKDVITLINRFESETQPTIGDTQGEFFAKKFSRFINNMNCDEEGFIEYMTNREHRTLQQKFFDMLLKALYKFSTKNDTWLDARNERATEQAKMIVEAIKDSDKISLSDFRLMKYIALNYTL